MNEVTKSKLDVDQAKLDTKDDGLMLKLLGYLLALVIGGAIVCFIIGLIKTTVDILIVVGAILLIVALLVVWAYHALKLRIREGRYKRLLNGYKEREAEAEASAASKPEE